MYVINKMDEASVQHVVADAGAFIRRAPLRVENLHNNTVKFKSLFNIKGIVFIFKCVVVCCI